MLTSWANHIALAASGFTIGVLARVQLLLTPASVDAALDRDRRPGEGFFESWGNRTDEQNKLLAEARRRSPALRYVSFAVLGLIAVLVAMIALSPVELEWWWLLGSLFAGGLFAELVSRLARNGRVSVVGWQGASGGGVRRLAGMVAAHEPERPDPPGTHEHA